MRANGDPLDYEARRARQHVRRRRGQRFSRRLRVADSEADWNRCSARDASSPPTQTGPLVLYNKQPVPVNP
jgi:hypothetical protein